MRSREGGYIQLDRGQSDLFPAQAPWVGQEIWFISLEDEIIKATDFQYDASKRRIKFSVPHEIQNQTIYHLDLFNIPKDNNTQIANNVKREEHNLTDSVTRTQARADGILESYNVKSILGPNGYHFRTSKYNTAREKMMSLRVKMSYNSFVEPLVDFLYGVIEGDELFDRFELTPFGQNLPLFQLNAVLTDNEWYENEIYPLIYQNYPFDSRVKIDRRNTSILGIPPYKAVSLRQFQDERELDKDNLHDEYTEEPDEHSKIQYRLALEMDRDLYNMRNTASRLFIGGNRLSRRVMQILESSFPTLKYGSYRVMMNYVLPGKILDQKK